MNLLDALHHVRARRRALARDFDVARQMARLEESCVPSYLHANPLAAGVAWWRLFAAVRMQAALAPAGAVLDFGAGSGELSQLLDLPCRSYDYVELDDALADRIGGAVPGARRVGLDDLPASRYAAIFALDSLEHNDNVGELIERLAAALAPDGVLILSGPTENALYRLGRRIAGFSGHYHKTDIAEIERLARARLDLVRRRMVPLGLPLFSVSAWRGRAAHRQPRDAAPSDPTLARDQLTQ